MKQQRINSAKNHVANECVQVTVRCRPLSNKERAESGGQGEIVSVYPNRGVVEIVNPNESNKAQRKVYTYDAVYDGSANQKTIYNEVVFPLVSSVLEGFNGCIFAYGQTGTGKTFTMEGIRGNNEMMGIIPRAFEQIWHHINRTDNFQFLVDVSYLEIYMEELRDLLKPQSKHLEIREGNSGVFVPNLHSINCKSVDDMLNVMHIGNKNRTVGFTNVNEHSSRSHAIFMIKIEMCDNATNTIKVGKLNLIDLAGSERQSKTGATAERLKEASKINLALSSLGNVISALAENVSHVPYRDSKLTRLLHNSLGGNSKTIMIANIGPSYINYNETLTTLRYASRAKTIQNQPIKNEDPQDAKLREYQAEIERLKQLLEPKKQILTTRTTNTKKRTKKPKSEKRTKNISAINENAQTPVVENITKDKDLEILNESEIESDVEEDSENLENVTKSNEDLERERIENMKLAAKLADLESQMVRGGQNLLDTYDERQIELENKLVEIAERKKREIEMQQQLELQEESTLEIRGTVTSLEQEVDLKKRKLSKCYAKFLSLQQELNDCKYEHNQDLRELEMAQNELVKELKRQLLIIDNFVPVEVKQRLYTQAKYDEEQEEWNFSNLKLPGNAADIKRPVANPLRRRPTSEYSAHATGVGIENFRFKSENILDYELEMPCRTTQEYQSPKVSASLRAVLAQAMKTDGDIEIVDTNAKSLRNRLDQIICNNAGMLKSFDNSIGVTTATTTNDQIAPPSRNVSSVSRSPSGINRRSLSGSTYLKRSNLHQGPKNGH